MNLDRILTACGVDPRGFRALVHVFILMDLRGQHFARATATEAHFLVSPLFWVIGQSLTISALTCLVLFMRVDVYFFVFANLSVSVLVMAATVLVEFQEIVLDPNDLDILGHRPIAPRTYAAARFANLGFYLLLIHLALHLMPLLMGMALRDGGFWFLPAYLLASLAVSLTTAALVILLLSAGGTSERLEWLKGILAWTQILLVGIFFYGAQLILRDAKAQKFVPWAQGHEFYLWAAFPPPWFDWLPTGWLARFVESAATAPSASTLLAAIAVLAVPLLIGAFTYWRMVALYRDMQPLARRHVRLSMAPQEVGRVGGWLAGRLARGREERIGFWLTRALLWREPGMQMGILMPINMAVAVVLLGLATGQFANPMVERDARLVTLPIFAVYMIPLAVPPIIYNLAFSRDFAAAWVLRTAPLDRPGDIARGACKVVMTYIVMPLCLIFGIVSAIRWGDPLAGFLHAFLAGMLSWPMALIALWLVLTDVPFSVPHPRGGTMAPVAVPMAVLASGMMLWAGLHFLFAASPLFWIGSWLVCVLAARPLGRQADARLNYLWRQA